MPSIIQYWHQKDCPDSIRSRQDQWRRAFPDQYELFDQQAALDFLSEHFGAEAVAGFQACAVPAMASDYFRYHRLAIAGGLYVDSAYVPGDPAQIVRQTDYPIFALSIPKADLHPDIVRAREVLGPILLNAPLRAADGSSPWFALLAGLVRRMISERASPHIPMVTGAGILTAFNHAVSQIHRGPAVVLADIRRAAPNGDDRFMAIFREFLTDHCIELSGLLPCVARPADEMDALFHRPAADAARLSDPAHWTNHQASIFNDGPLSVPKPGFTAALIANIGSLRHQLIETPVIDEWLAAVDPPAARDSAHIDRLTASFSAQSDRWDRLAARLDAVSREKLRSILLFRALGYQRYRLPWADAPDIAATYAAAEAGIVGPAQLMPPQPYPIHRFAIEYCGQHLQMETGLGIMAAIFVVRQYYHAQACIRPGDVVIDGGGCFGDTALAFAAETGPDGHVFSFEPSASNRDTFTSMVSLNPALADRITLCEQALSDRHGAELRLVPEASGSRIMPDGTEVIRAATLNQLIQDGQLERVDFIKLDIEGHETEALKGAGEVLARFKPRLAIAAYHRPLDMLDLSELILRFRPDYQLHLGHVTSNQTETVLFAR